MNIIGNNIIEHIFKFIHIKKFKKYRLLCKNVNKAIIFMYYSTIIINLDRMLYIDERAFIDLINKNRLYINIINLRFIKQLNNYLKLCKHKKIFKSIVFHYDFNEELKTSLPEGLKSLEFGRSFNKKLIQEQLPNSLTILKFGYSFDQLIGIDILPIQLKVLRFGTQFRKKILINVLPYGLTYLNFDDYFNQKILPKVLPETIKYLKFGNSFLHDLNDENLPKKLHL
jgi:hypothetical protein